MHEIFLKVFFEVKDYKEIVRRTFSRVGHKLVPLTNVSEKRTYMFIIFMDTRNIDVFFRGYSQIPF